MTRSPETSRGNNRRKTVTPARMAAFDVLMSVNESDSYANLLLPPLLRKRQIHGRDAAFATELTYGTLRMQGRYDAIIDQVSTRPVAEIDESILVILRMGAHQLLELKIPSHAAVSQSVALARNRISAGPAQMVNAVLRRMTEKPMDAWLPSVEDNPSDDQLGKYFSHPEWIVRAYRQALAAKPSAKSNPSEDLLSLLEANNTPAQVHLVSRLPHDRRLETQDLQISPGKYAPTCLYLHQGSPSSIEEIRQGNVGVQDEGSQLVTLAFLHAEVKGEDSTWLDLTAGPGGKAALMASIMAQRGGGRLVANELHDHRVRLVQQNLKAIPDSVQKDLRTGDGRDLGNFEPGHYDRVIVDAPCTGLGALRRRPESRWRRQPDDLPALTQLQRQLLISALKAVRVGGVVGYITCSPHLAETSLIVDDARKQLLREGIHAEVEDAVALAESVATEKPLGLHSPFVQLWPHIHGTDAMFLSVLRRCA